MASDAVAGWLAVVDDDLRQVVNNLKGPMPSLSGAAHHCQQAAEKLAVLTDSAIPVPKSHDIGALVAMLPANHRLKGRLEELEKRTPYGVVYRYPSEDRGEIPSAAAIEAWLSEIKAARSMI